MRELILDSRDFAILLKAANTPEAHQYALSSLSITLSDIGLPIDLSRALSQLVESLAHVTDSEFRNDVQRYLLKHHVSLSRHYARHYEHHRRTYFREHVLPCLGRGERGRVLDLGCGRGLAGAWLLEGGHAKEVVGIDEADFSRSWDTLGALWDTLSFTQVSPEDLSAFLHEQEPFDAILLQWVLHHSTIAECNQTLDALRRSTGKEARVVVVEDAWSQTRPASYDPNGFAALWDGLPVRNGVKGWDAQVLLDFVAVRLLARYRNVAMTFNYMHAEGWIDLFEKYGFVPSDWSAVGFPAKRDIAVPQSVFSFERGEGLRANG